MYRFHYFLVLSFLVFLVSLQMACSEGKKEGTCNPACASDEECVNNACQKKQSGCNPACATDEACVNNACQKKQTECNPACATDEECVNNTCQKKQTGCNPACASDEECVNNTCQKKQTVCNPACATDEECVNNACQKKQTGCSPACAPDEECANNTCQKKKAECNPACTSEQICSDGICRKKPPNGVGTVCTDASPCPSGLECHKSNRTSYCFERCTKDEDCNYSYRNKCLTTGTDPQGNPLMLCLHESARGEECGFAGPQQAFCKKGQTPELYCDEGTSKCAEVCQNTSPRCPPGYLCGEGEKCYQSCDPMKPQCPGGALCFLLGTGEGICAKGKAASLNEPCDQKLACEKLPCDQTAICGAGLYCSSAFKVCSPFCTYANSKCPAENPACALRHSKWGVCVRSLSGVKEDSTCHTNVDCAFGLICFRLTGNIGVCAPLCDEKNPCKAGKTCKQTNGSPKGVGACMGDITGPKELGDNCHHDPKKAATDACKKGLTCLGFEGAPNGFCSGSCDHNPSVCNKERDGKTMSCQQINRDGTKICVFTCTDKADCPSDTVCAQGICHPNF
ncbi:MAG: hypothetical protein EP343_02765 [Deltaproteobacteria bacterium]|nr:MAG: hypothetical protein EP343_02765 [Deltaproteobacteria bacterium]